MKKTFWLILCIGMLISGIAAAANDSPVLLKSAKELNASQAYLCGDFFEKNLWLNTSYVYMIIQNEDTHGVYELPFEHKHLYSYYPIPVGKYQITDFDIRIPLSQPQSNGSAAAPGFLGNFIKSTTRIAHLKINSDLRREFELKSGECLYIGDYLAQYVNETGDFTEIIRSAKINLYPHFDVMAKDFQQNKKDSSLALQSLDIKESVASPYNPPGAESLKAIIAGRFILQSKANPDYEAILFNLVTKKTYIFKFLKKSDIQTIEVTPGEYFISTLTVGGTFGLKTNLDDLVPNAVLLPFEVKPNELLYLGGIVLEEKGNSIYSSYYEDNSVALPELKANFSQNSIRSIQEDPKN